MNRSLQLMMTLMVGLCSGCGPEVSFSNGDLIIEVDNRMHWRVENADSRVGTFHEAFYPEGSLCVDDLTLADFKIQQAECDSTGYHLVGRCDRGDVSFEKHWSIRRLTSLPGMALVETFYVNRGRSVTLHSTDQMQMRIDVDSMVWSFQPSTSMMRRDWIQPVTRGFEQENFLGMNNTDYGGGIPMVDLWRKDGGMATGLVEPTLQPVSMPVKWMRTRNSASMSLHREYAWLPELKPGDTLRLDKSFVAVHRGDFYNPLHLFARYMKQYVGIRFADSEPEAFEPVWGAWGYKRDFTPEEVIATLPKVAELGFGWVDIDDGYQKCEGDWEPCERFPHGGRDMRRMADSIHAYGMKAKLWWAPLAADPDSEILKRHPEMLLLTNEGAYRFITWWNSFYLSPSNPTTREYSLALVDRFLREWNYDGLKLDGQHLNCCPEDYNRQNGLEHAIQAPKQLPLFYKSLFDHARSIKDYAVIELCPCGCAFNFFNMPYINQAVASDPMSSRQIRQRCKTYKAINQSLAFFADHVELSDKGCDFATQVGIGAVPGSKFTWSENPDPGQDFLLTPEKEELFRKWIGIYRQKMLSRGRYLNLYDIGWDTPECHVIEREGRMYYAFYAEEWSGAGITLRGLDPQRTYTVCEYADSQREYTVEGRNPVIRPRFRDSYLIEVY